VAALDASEARALSPERRALALQLYSVMVRIRRFEERTEELFRGGELPGFVHLSIGQEACAAGMCTALGPGDYITSTHRGHGHTIAKGAPTQRMMAELFGKATGSCRGKGGSMHIADFSVGMLGANGVVAGGINLAVGAALGARLRGSDQIAVCFFGDGATNRGPFHEGLNMAAVYGLPVIFFNENNQYGSTTSAGAAMRIVNVADRAVSYGMPGVMVDGNDALAVYDCAQEWVARCRAGEGPVLIEAKTYRMKGHYVGDPESYRDAADVQAWLDRDPIQRLRAQLEGSDLHAIDVAAHEEIEAAVAFARDSPLPDPDEAFRDLFACPF
jgi:acetoin:2,6-dichlorophenolindophenol oxidoreductase subunit alpha